MKTVIYEVPNISCSHCVHTIEMEVGGLPGVELVDAQEDSKQVTITYREPASEMRIKTLLAEINYPVKENES
ncbi:MAG: heavy-metal-associated domain-containing protein [Anaerolineales bacterium]